MQTRLDKLLLKAEDLGWTIIQDENETEIELCKSSPEGQDFHICIDTENDADYFLQNLYDYINDFDISYEAYIWLDHTGHGKNGAPYEMIDVYKDMEACLEMTRELLYELEQI